MMFRMCLMASRSHRAGISSGGSDRRWTKRFAALAAVEQRLGLQCLAATFNFVTDLRSRVSAEAMPVHTGQQYTFRAQPPQLPDIQAKDISCISIAQPDRHRVINVRTS